MKQQNKVLIYLCYAYFFLIPIEDFFLQDIIGSSTRIAIGALLITYYYFGNKIKWSIVPKYLYYYLFIVVASIFLWARLPDYYAVFRILMWVLTTVLISNLIYAFPKTSSTFFKIYVFSCLYLVYKSFMFFMSFEEASRVEVEGINDNILGMHFLICSMYCLFIFFDKKTNSNKKLISILGLLIFIAAIITTGSRSGFLALIIGFFILIPKSLNRVGSVISLCLVSLLVVLSISDDNVFVNFASDRIDLAQVDKGAGRIVIWKVGSEMIKDNPYFGVGYRNFPNEFKNYFDRTPLDFDEIEKIGINDRSGAHNNVIEILAELGLLGLLSFYILQIVVCYKLHKLFQIIPVSKLLFALIIALNINGLFSDLTNLKLYWTILGIACGLSYYGLKMIQNESIVPSIKLPS